jgi:hypothetical protein
MRLARYAQFVGQDRETALRICLGPRRAGPAGSTRPWQLDGVLSTLIKDGYDPARIFPCWQGSSRSEQAGRLEAVLHYHGISMVYPCESGEGQVEGSNVIHLPLWTVAGAMESAWRELEGGRKRRTRLTSESAADLLAIHQKSHPGIFAVMDGTLATTSVLLAGSDLVAVDAVAAKMMGLDPLSIDYIRVAHDRGLGCGDIQSIEVVGDDPNEVQLGLKERRLPLLTRPATEWGRLFQSY